MPEVFEEKLDGKPFLDTSDSVPRNVLEGKRFAALMELPFPTSLVDRGNSPHVIEDRICVWPIDIPDDCRRIDRAAHAGKRWGISDHAHPHTSAFRKTGDHSKGVCASPSIV